MTIKTAERNALKAAFVEKSTATKTADNSEALLGELEGAGPIASATVTRSAPGVVEVTIVPASYTIRFAFSESGTMVEGA